MNIKAPLQATLTMLTMAALTACSSTTAKTGTTEMRRGVAFEITDVSVSPMTKASLCSALGGQGQPPTLTIKHTTVAGVPIRVKLTDYWSDGGTFNHRSTRATSDGSGTTSVTYAFLPPCNTTGGRINSDYRFTVEAGDDAQTLRWGRFDSGSRSIQ
jgi:hypothetical protein